MYKTCSNSHLMYNSFYIVIWFFYKPFYTKVQGRVGCRGCMIESLQIFQNVTRKNTNLVRNLGLFVVLDLICFIINLSLCGENHCLRVSVSVSYLLVNLSPLQQQHNSEPWYWSCGWKFSHHISTLSTVCPLLYVPQLTTPSWVLKHKWELSHFTERTEMRVSSWMPTTGLKMIIMLELGPASEVSAGDHETMWLVRVLATPLVLCVSLNHAEKYNTHIVEYVVIQSMKCQKVIDNLQIQII